MNRKLSILMTAVGLALAVLFTVSCEDTDLAAPVGGEIRLIANPATINIDPDLGQIDGKSSIRATLFDESGLPVQGVTVLFSATSGTINPLSAKTDSSGVAQVTLTLTNDDVSAEVTAQSGALSTFIVVSTNIGTTNRPPFAEIQATPAMSQLVNRIVAFDGTLSLDPDDDSITCYQWRINSDSTLVPPEVLQGTGQSTFDRMYPESVLDGVPPPGERMNLSITLRVSDSVAVGTDCAPFVGNPASSGGVLLPPDRFSPNARLLNYAIECQNPPPIADAGADIRQFVQFAQQIILDGTASFDNETPIDKYQWDCGNGTQPQKPTSFPPGRVICSYFRAGIYEAQLKVFDQGTGQVNPANGNWRCQKSAVDTVVVDIFQ